MSLYKPTHILQTLQILKNTVARNLQEILTDTNIILIFWSETWNQFSAIKIFWCINIWILQFYHAMFLTYMHTVLCRSQAIPLFFIFSYKNAKRVQRFLETCRHKWKNRVCTILTSSKVNVWYDHLMTA